MERTIVVTILTLGLLAGLGRGLDPHGRREVATAATTPPVATPLANAASSRDELIARFLDALGSKDRAALHQLRVNEQEYRDVILAGTVPPGQPVRTWRKDVVDWAWATLHTKSTYYEAFLIDGFGGHTWHVDQVDFRKGTKAYAAYTAFKQLDLMVTDETGRQSEIRTGSIAEVGGAYKFISYVRD